ncbi:MAG TPA: LegC family aminotransferase [Bacteroidia bacterium]|nr:LegC family aminotransferase [Bacteroidia bacterium]
MIPLSVPNINGNEWKYVKDCLDTGWISAVGSYVDKFEQTMAAYTGAKYAVAVANGTCALHLSCLLMNIQQGDGVIVPDITFIASVNSIKQCGAEPILMDVNEQNWQMDLQLLESFLSTDCEIINGICAIKKSKRKIKAIMPVHVLGHMCNMQKLKSIAIKFNLKVIEDATEALGSTYKSKHAGTMGDIGCLSFNGNKIISTGGGGVILTNNKEIAKLAKHLSTQAKTSPEEYIHDANGFNYRMVNILAAIGMAQMEQLPSFLHKKKDIAEQYHKKLNGVGDIQFIETEKNVVPNNWLFTIRTKKRKALFQHLKNSGVQSRPLWQPMHMLAIHSKHLFVTKNNISTILYNDCLSIPCSTDLKIKDQSIVIKKVVEFFST